MRQHTDDVEPTELRPAFVLPSSGPRVPQRTLEKLRMNLQRISVLKQSAAVRIDATAPLHPPDMPTVLKSRDADRLGCSIITICVRPIYRDYSTGELYPAVLRSLKRGMGRAMKQAFFTFAQNAHQRAATTLLFARSSSDGEGGLGRRSSAGGNQRQL